MYITFPDLLQFVRETQELLAITLLDKNVPSFVVPFPFPAMCGSFLRISSEKSRKLQKTRSN